MKVIPDVLLIFVASIAGLSCFRKWGALAFWLEEILAYKAGKIKLYSETYRIPEPPSKKKCQAKKPGQ